MLNITLITNNNNLIENLFNKITLNLLDKYRIVKICSTGNNVLDCILDNKTDVILLYINIPNTNITKIFDIIYKENIKSKIIILSENSEILTNIIKENSMIYGIFLMPFNIDDLITTLNNLYKNTYINSNEILENLLSQFEFNKTTIGYNYIVEILEICINENHRYIPIMKKIYDKISKNKSISNSSIGWNIAKTIDNMRKNTNQEIINKYFKFPPSPKIFLNTILTYYYNILRNKKV